jgi:tetratricopeptide (TPR) repeat protein
MKKLLEGQPNDPIALQRMGALYEKNAMFSDAATSYEQALRLNPSLLVVTTKLAELNAGPLKNNNKAMNFAKRARELAPTDPKIAGLLGNIAYQIGNFDWAYSLLQESVRNRPDDVATRQTFAWTSYSLGKISEAQQTMQEVLKAASDPHQIEEAKSFLEMTALSQTPKDLTASEHEVERILQADPNNVPALMVKAELASQRNEKKSAADIYNKVLRRYPDFSPAQKQLASLYADSDAADLDKAYDLAVKARKKLPEDADLTRILAEISYKKKDFAYALQLLSESARKKPLDAKALYYFGMSSLQLKQNAQARDALHRALEAGLQEPFSTEARQAIPQLR